MKLYHLAAAILLTACSTSVKAPLAKVETKTKTTWAIMVETDNGKRMLEARPSGGRVPVPGPLVCAQMPMPKPLNDVQEVSVICGLNEGSGNFILFGKCLLSQPDTNVSQLMVRSGNQPWLLTIACQTK